MQDKNAATPPPPPPPTTTTTTDSAATTTGSVVTMTIAKYKDVILETIDQLRQRKARPDLERISHMLQRKHGISFRETEAILGKLVDSQVVFKVDYKGSTSYRNAAKWRINHLASSGSIGGLTQNSDQVKQKLREAVRALAVGCGNSSSNNSNSISNNTSSSNSSNSSSNSSGNASGGGRKGRPQPNNDGNNSGTHTPSVTAALGDKKSNSAVTVNSTTPTDAFNNVDSEAFTTSATPKRGNSTARADKASAHARATSSDDKNNNSKSPAGGNGVPDATATMPPTTSSATNQTSTAKRGGNKKEYTGPVGITLKDLENWLTKQDSENLLVKNLLVTALQREVHAGWLKRLRNGNYIDVASIGSNSKKRSGNNKGNAKNTSTSSGAPASSVIASTPATSTPSPVCSVAAPSSVSSTAKGHTKPTVTNTPNTNNNNNIIIFTNSTNSTTNNATLITTTTCSSSSTSSPTNSSFASQPAKPNHGTKRSASAASLNSFHTASQQLISSSTPSLLPTSDVTTQGQHGATLVLFPSSSPTTSAGHPTLLLPVSSTQAPNDSVDRRTALLTTPSSASASPFPSSSSSPSSVYSPSGSTYHNNNALARMSLSATPTTPSSTAVAAGSPGPSRESVPAARRDNNNAKPAKSAAPQPAGPTNAPVPVKRGRPASKRKRFKKTPGPEFETEDILKSGPEKCVTCCLTAQANKHGEPEDLLVCKDCNTTVHPSCLDYCEELALRVRNSPWQCIECKTCYVCDDSGDGDSMLFCDACDKGYHMKCHVPGVDQKPKGKWVCGQCVSENGNSLEQPMEFEASNSEGSRASSPSATGIHLEPMEASGPSCLPTPCDSPVQPDPEEKEIGREDISISLPMLRDFQGPYPDAANWTIDDVVNFFKSAGFVSQAEAFREQEIDGKSLLLMKRSDVLTGLSLKLGPALKMYTHVQNLQLVGQSSFVSGIGR